MNPMDMLGETNRGRLAVGAEATFFVAEGDPCSLEMPSRRCT